MKTAADQQRSPGPKNRYPVGELESKLVKDMLSEEERVSMGRNTESE